MFIKMNELLKEISNNYKQYFKLGIGLDNYLFSSGNGITYCLSNRNDSFFNVILNINQSDTEFSKQKFISVFESFTSSNYPFRIKVVNKDNQNLIEQYYSQKIQKFSLSKEDNAVFWFNPEQHNFSISEKKLYKLKFLIVKSKNELSEWWKPFQYAFNVKSELKQFVIDFNFNAKIKNPNNFYNIIGYYNSNPVCCSTLFITNQMACLYDVGTIPNFRNNGFSTQMLLYLSNFTKNLGYKSMGLYSTFSGNALYKKVKFKKLGIIKTYNFHN